MARSLEKIVEVFGFGKIQDFLTLLDLIAANGFTIEDLRRYREDRIATHVARRNEVEAFQKAFIERAKRCPACRTVMNLAPVNTGPRDQVGGNYRSQWICPADDCMETIFNLETPADILRGMGLEPPRPPAPKPRKQKKCGGCHGKA